MCAERLLFTPSSQHFDVERVVLALVHAPLRSPVADLTSDSLFSALGLIAVYVLTLRQDALDGADRHVIVLEIVHYAHCAAICSGLPDCNPLRSVRNTFGSLRWAPLHLWRRLAMSSSSSTFDHIVAVHIVNIWRTINESEEFARV